MWNKPLTVEAPVEVVVSRPATRKVYKPEETSITFVRNERPDIDYKGYAAYLFQFDYATEPGDKEVYQAIISAATMDEAIATFVADAVRGDDYYVNAKYSVEIIGIDLNPKRQSKWLMEV